MPTTCIPQQTSGSWGPRDAAAGKAVKKRKKDDDLKKFEVTWPEEVSERGRLLRERRRKKRGSRSASGVASRP